MAKTQTCINLHLARAFTVLLDSDTDTLSGKNASLLELIIQKSFDTMKLVTLLATEKIQA